MHKTRESSVPFWDEFSPIEHPEYSLVLGRQEKIQICIKTPSIQDRGSNHGEITILKISLKCAKPGKPSEAVQVTTSRTFLSISLAASDFRKRAGVARRLPSVLPF